MKKILKNKIVKKIFAVVISASILFCGQSEGNFSSVQIAKAADSEPNWNGGAYTTANIFAQINLYGQCTWYAWGRAYELTGIKLPCRNDAKTWYSVASSNGYSVGAEPAENAIAVWTNGTSGHVAFVESVSGNNVTISESNWGVGKVTYTEQYSLAAGKQYYAGRKTLTKSEMQTRGTFAGYIYLTSQPSAAATVAASGTWRITATDGVNVRSGAGTGYGKVGFYAYNTVVTIYEKTTANGYTWGHTSDGWFVLDYAVEENSDKEAPLISMASVTGLTNTGFAVSAVISDNVAVTDVRVAVWTETDGQDDLHWYSCMNGWSANNFNAVWDLAGYGYAEDTYNIHIYAYDAAGNSSGYPLSYYFKKTASAENSSAASAVSSTTEQNVTAAVPVEITDDGNLNQNIDNVVSTDTTVNTDATVSTGSDNIISSDIAGGDTETESTSIEFMENNISLNAGEEDDIEYEVFEADDSAELIWYSSNTSVAVVEEDGHIIAIDPGTAVITAELPTGEKAQCTVTVEGGDDEITSLKLKKTELSMSVGDTKWLDVILEPEDADEELLIYSSSNKKAVKVENGIITAVSAGTAVITVEYDNLKATCTVTVKATVLKLKKTSATMKKGKKVKIQATSSSGRIKYSSSNKKVATVNAKGEVRARKKGKAVIYVKANGVTKKFKVNVK